jgi:hypothetical protein
LRPYPAGQQSHVQQKESFNEKTRRRIGDDTLLCNTSLPIIASAQQPTPPAQTPEQTTVTQPEVTLPDGTELTVITTEEISSKTATEGDPLSFKVDEDVVINGKTVIKAGALVKGSVAACR